MVEQRHTEQDELETFADPRLATALAAAFGADPDEVAAQADDRTITFAWQALPPTEGPSRPSETVVTVVLSPAGPDSGQSTVQAGRHVMFEEIGHGGMGRVLRGQDPDLGRDLAIKILLDRHRDDPVMQRRFVDEARITGQLQHPGVVPVYELGRFADGRPFFTMKLVQGQTLAVLLQKRTYPGQNQERLLSVIEQVCQTLAYAHSHGVVHRDLKPGNIMVGRFGEVQVMDWGLARVVQQTARPQTADTEESAGACVLAVTSSSFAPTATLTQEGVALGTPAYMPPEQARGESGCDQRADVFGLGALLCHLLTGQPPFVAATTAQTHELAARCDLTGAVARLETSGADPELIRLTWDCLAPNPADRPGDAGEVAERLAAYRAGVQERLRRAEREQAIAEARAAQALEVARRERRGRHIAVSASCLLVMVGSVGLWYQRGEQSAPHGRALPPDMALRESSRPGVDIPLSHPEPKGAERARLAINQGLACQARGDLHGAEAAFRRAIATDRAYAEAHSNLGIALRAQGKLAEAEAAYREAIRLKPNLPEAHNNLGIALRQQGRLAEAEAAWREAIRLKPADPEAHNNLGQFLLAQKKLPEAVACYNMAIQLAPRNAEFYNSRGLARQQMGRQAEAIADFEKALTLSPALLGPRENLGVALANVGKLDQAIAILQSIIRQSPTSVNARVALGRILEQKKDLDGAIALWRGVLQLDPNRADVCGLIGDALLLKGQFKEAVVMNERCLALLPAGDPSREVVSRRVRAGKLLPELDKRVESLLKGRLAVRDGGRAAELVEAGSLLRHYKRRYVLAVLCYTEAFRRDRDLAGFLRGQHRYAAACTAALAGCGKGADTAKLTDKNREEFRAKALGWLNADLAAWRAQARKSPDTLAEAQRALKSWQTNPDLAGVRGDAVAMLPAGERDGWRKLWSEVARLLLDSGKDAK